MTEQQTAASNRDPILEKLVQFANGGMELSITLYVKGLVVTGRLIAAKTYWEAFEQQLRTAEVTAAGEAWRTPLADFAKEIHTKQSVDIDVSVKTPVEHIHIANAKFYTGHLMANTSESLYWRGRLDSVDGFSVGEMSPTG